MKVFLWAAAICVILFVALCYATSGPVAALGAVFGVALLVAIFAFFRMVTL
jgi:hypothetical protein